MSLSRVGRALSALAVLLSGCSVARASDWDDCFSEVDLRVIVEGCTGIVSSDHLADWQRAMALVNRGAAYAGLGDPQSAGDDYSRAINLQPHYAKAHFNRGTLHLNAGRGDQALEDFGKAISLDPYFADSYLNR